MLDINALMNAGAAQLVNLIPKGKHPGVCAEIFPHLNSFPKRDRDKKVIPGEIETVVSVVFSFELTMKDGSVRVIDTESLTIQYGDGKPVNIAGDRSAIAKFLIPWHGGLTGEDFDKWFVSYSSFPGRQVIVNIGHETTDKGTAYHTINSVMEAMEGAKTFEVSKDYVSFVERNKDRFEWDDEMKAYMRIWTAKKEEGEGEGEGKKEANLSGKTKSVAKGTDVGQPNADDIPF